MCFFFFKQKTAYDVRISDWSSDVCSSDLVIDEILLQRAITDPAFVARTAVHVDHRGQPVARPGSLGHIEDARHGHAVIGRKADDLARHQIARRNAGRASVEQRRTVAPRQGEQKDFTGGGAVRSAEGRTFPTIEWRKSEEGAS